MFHNLKLDQNKNKKNQNNFPGFNPLVEVYNNHSIESPYVPTEEKHVKDNFLNCDIEEDSDYEVEEHEKIQIPNSINKDLVIFKTNQPTASIVKIPEQSTLTESTENSNVFIYKQEMMWSRIPKSYQNIIFNNLFYRSKSNLARDFEQNIDMYKNEDLNNESMYSRQNHKNKFGITQRNIMVSNDLNKTIIHSNTFGTSVNKDKEKRKKKRVFFQDFSEEMWLKKNKFIWLVSNEKEIIQYLDNRSIWILSTLSIELWKSWKPRISDIISKEVYSTKNKKSTYQIKRSLLKRCHSDNKNLNQVYSDYFYKKGNKNYDNEILHDLTRTFPLDPSFKVGASRYSLLKRLLTAYSKYNTKIGYAQGLNFIYGHSIFLFDKEEEVFFFVDEWIKKLNFEKLYGVNNYLNLKMEAIGRIWERHAPKIHRFLKDNYWNHEFFMANWVLTLFSNSMEQDYVFIVWDFMIVFGWKFFYCLVVKILLRFQDEIISKGVMNLPYDMKQLLKTNEFKSEFHEILNDALNMLNKYIWL